LVVVVQRGLLLEAVSAEVVAAIHHKIWALAQFEQRLDEIREHLSRLFVAGVLGQRLEVIFDLEYESHEVSLVTELLGRVPRLRVQVGERVDWGARGDGADLYAAVTEQPREPAPWLEEPGEPALHGPQSLLHHLWQIAERDVHPGLLCRPIDAAGNLVAEKRVALPLLGPEQLLYGIIERAHPRLHRGAGVELAQAVVLEERRRGPEAHQRGRTRVASAARGHLVLTLLAGVWMMHGDRPH